MFGYGGLEFDRDFFAGNCVDSKEYCACVRDRVCEIWEWKGGEKTHHILP